MSSWTRVRLGLSSTQKTIRTGWGAVVERKRKMNRSTWLTRTKTRACCTWSTIIEAGWMQTTTSHLVLVAVRMQPQRAYNRRLAAPFRVWYPKQSPKIWQCCLLNSLSTRRTKRAFKVPTIWSISSRGSFEIPCNKSKKRKWREATQLYPEDKVKWCKLN